ALVVSGSEVYAGGRGTVAKWDGSSWSALGSGMGPIDSDLEPPWVYALAVPDNGGYAGGEFTTAGGSAANYIAKWNGGSWAALGSGLNGSVLTVAVSGSNVYVGGTLATSGGSPVTNIAKWNGSSWLSPGSGVNGDVFALAVSGSDVYVGGYFN